MPEKELKKRNGQNDGPEEENYMVYYKDDELVIRNMEEGDARILTDEYTAQG